MQFTSMEMLRTNENTTCTRFTGIWTHDPPFRSEAYHQMPLEIIQSAHRAAGDNTCSPDINPK